MRQNYGNRRRQFSENEPKVYDKELRVVHIDIQADTQVRNESSEEEATMIQGYSFFEVQIDGSIDYGHIKSQLIESAYPQKDEHAFVINALNVLIKERSGDALTKDDEEAIEEYELFNEWRSMCADAARVVVQAYK